MREGGKEERKGRMRRRLQELCSLRLAERSSGNDGQAW